MTEREPAVRAAADTQVGGLPTTQRRALLKGMAAAGIAVPFLGACASGGSSSEASGTGGGGSTRSNGSGGAAGGNGGAGGSGGAGGDVIATTNQVPNGGGIILQDAGVVITQPDAGDFKAFSDICTHAGCPVSSVSDGTINCLCHGSQYSITDGSVVAGPAPSPLPAKSISVKGKNILLV